MAQEILDRNLENRSKLVFSFRKTNSHQSIIRTLHFAENIDVKESVRANYSEYTPLGNNGSVFAYLGSQSRDITVDFQITLQNIMEHTLIKPPTQKSKSKITKSSYFQKAKSPFDSVSNYFNKSHKSIQSNIEHFANQFLNSISSDGANNESLEIALREGRENRLSYGITEGTSAQTRSVSILKVMYWVNLIRSSVMTNSAKPSLGPPIVSLVHGILYQNVPCIVTDYNISYDSNAGLDEVTLLPRRLKVSLKMKEVRLRGQSFDPSDDQNRNMMPGYESFIEDGFATFDPMNSIYFPSDGASI